jgi:hypothetical protein
MGKYHNRHGFETGSTKILPRTFILVWQDCQGMTGLPTVGGVY